MKRLLLIFLLWPSLAFGAFTEFYCQTTGSNLNAGSTTSDAAAFTYTSAVLVWGWDAATGVFTVLSGNPSGDGVAVGDFASVYVTIGAVSTGFVGRVTARDTTTITVSLTAASGTAPATDALGATTLKIGGAWAGPNGAVGFPFGFAASAMVNAAGDAYRVNLKSGTTYAITAAMTHGAVGGRFQGYSVTPGDNLPGHASKAVIDGGTTGASYTLLSVTAANNVVSDFIFQNNGATASATGVSVTGGETLVRRCVVSGMRGFGIATGTVAGITLIEVEAFGCNTSNSAVGAINLGFINTTAIRCISHDNTTANGHGFYVAAGAVLIGCISESNGGIGYRVASTTYAQFINCDAYNNAGSGLDLQSASSMIAVIENSNFVKNGGYGINSAGSATLRNGAITNCGFGSGTQANASGQVAAIAITPDNSVTYPADVTPWVNPANGDFRINLAAAKGAGRGAFTQTAASYAGTIGYPDIGAAQHKPTAAGFTIP